MVSVHHYVAVLRGTLANGEQERLWIRAIREEPGHAGALLLTDRALRWSGAGGLTTSQDAFAFADIGGPRLVPYGAHGRGAALRFELAGDVQTFSGRRPDVERMLAALLGQAPAPRTDPPRPLVDELERLVRLRDAGALAGDEFEAAKRRLLDPTGSG